MEPLRRASAYLGELESRIHALTQELLVKEEEIRQYTPSNSRSKQLDLFRSALAAVKTVMVDAGPDDDDGEAEYEDEDEEEDEEGDDGGSSGIDSDPEDDAKSEKSTDSYRVEVFIDGRLVASHEAGHDERHPEFVEWFRFAVPVVLTKTGHYDTRAMNAGLRKRLQIKVWRNERLIYLSKGIYGSKHLTNRAATYLAKRGAGIGRAHTETEIERYVFDMAGHSKGKRKFQINLHAKGPADPLAFGYFEIMSAVEILRDGKVSGRMLHDLASKAWNKPENRKLRISSQNLARAARGLPGKERYMMLSFDRIELEKIELNQDDDDEDEDDDDDDDEDDDDDDEDADEEDDEDEEDE